MSLATLKKKTQAKYHNSSVNVPQFSLVGSYRNQGYVGQTSLSRSLPRTTIKGSGYGGCCGKFHVYPPVLSLRSTEDSSVVKKSVINTPGLLATKYRWIRRPFPFTKVDNSQSVTNSSDYVAFLRKQTINSDISACMVQVQSKPCNIKEPDNKITALSQGEYLYKLHVSCAQYDISYLRQERSFSTRPNTC